MPQTVIRPLEHADYPQVAALQNAHYLNHFYQTPQQMAQTDLEPLGIAQVMLALVQGFFLQSILLDQDAALEAETYIQARATRASRDAFDAALARVPDILPALEDRL